MGQGTTIELTDRNMAILKARLAGASYLRIGKEFGISESRAQQVVWSVIRRYKRRGCEDVHSLARAIGVYPDAIRQWIVGNGKRARRGH